MPMVLLKQQVQFGKVNSFVHKRKGKKMAQSLLETIIEAYPELATDRTPFHNLQIMLQDDSDGQGAYIAKWEYSKPIPDGLKLGK